MLDPKQVQVRESWEVHQELQSLGLTTELVTTVARACSAAKAESLEIDPCSAPGTMAYIKGVRHIRLQLIPQGWEVSRAGNVESTVNHERGIQLCFQNVDIACTSQDPLAISGKGAGSRKLILDGQADLFGIPAQGQPVVRGSVPTVWVLCVSIDAKKLRAEVSCPKIFEGNQFSGFSKRIFVVDEDLNPSPSDNKLPDDDIDGEEFEVRIAKK
jgi:hypothetical protein